MFEENANPFLSTTRELMRDIAVMSRIDRRARLQRPPMFRQSTRPAQVAPTNPPAESPAQNEPSEANEGKHQFENLITHNY